jgi:two-component system sensor kinase FixL
MGLGLSITRSIVEAHGGRIWADASVEEGASLCVRLLARQDEVDPGRSHTPAPAATQRIATIA